MLIYQGLFPQKNLMECLKILLALQLGFQIHSCFKIKKYNLPIEHGYI